jgi:large subunit ribosomal protein L24
MKQKKNKSGKPRRSQAAVVAIKMKLKKGDKVIVMTGKDKGKTGTLAHVFPKTNRVIIEGVAIAKRHTKAKAGQSSRIIEVARSINASNVMLSVDDKGSRVGRRVEDGKIIRFAKKGGATLK